MKVTKESLVRDRENSNVAFLTLKQKYFRTDGIYLIVEGKDDFTYYSTLLQNDKDIHLDGVLAAGGREKVIGIYYGLDWSHFSKKRVLLCIDRDFSEITKEITPVDSNVYVTDKYSIENSIFDEDLMIRAIKYFYSMPMIDVGVESSIREVYRGSVEKFNGVFSRLMVWIIYIIMSKADYPIGKIVKNDIYDIEAGVIRLKKMDKEIDDYICDLYKLDNDQKRFDEIYIEFEKYNKEGRLIRGKYVRSFFVDFYNSMKNYDFGDGSSVKKSLSPISDKNVLVSLCGYAKIPESFRSFISNNR